MGACLGMIGPIFFPGRYCGFHRRKRPHNFRGGYPRHRCTKKEESNTLPRRTNHTPFCRCCAISSRWPSAPRGRPSPRAFQKRCLLRPLPYQNVNCTKTIAHGSVGDEHPPGSQGGRGPRDDGAAAAAARILPAVPALCLVDPDGFCWAGAAALERYCASKKGATAEEPETEAAVESAA